MADRSIVVRLRAEVSDFNAQIGSASKSLSTLIDESKQFDKKATTTMGQIVQSAKLQREAWTGTGQAMIAAGAPVLAFNAAIAKTGIEYNTLQQKSRAAMRTLMGGAREANDQMDKLDEFARTSPFSKAVFISAQQQMLGFGIEAQKVIPYLSAINDAVAATGGSNEDISELTRIFSQVKAAAKITATDLMQFGQRGVDAATLIGSQMGKTGAEIRGEITNGTLDAGQALDALAAGMSERFAGASANVKNTMTGATDRVKAAWRDMASLMTEPLVGKNGGGLLVDATNGLADFLRLVQKLPAPILQVGGLLSTMASGAVVLGGSLLVLIPRIVETKAALDAMRTGPLAGVYGGFLKVAKGVGIAAAAFAAVQIAGTILSQFTAHALDAAKAAEEVERAANGVGDLGRIFRDADDPARELAGGVRDVASAFKFVNGIDHSWGAKLGYAGENAVAGLFGLESQMDRVGQSFKNLDAAVSGMDASKAATVMADVVKQAREAGVSTERLIALFPEYKRKLEDQATQLGITALTAQDYADWMGGEVPVAIRAAASATKEGTEALEEMDPAAKKAAEAASKLAAKWLEMVSAASTSFVSIRGAYQSVIDKNKELAEKSADATKSTTDSWTAFYDGVTVKTRDWIKALEEQVAAQRDWQTNMLTLSSRVSQGMIDELARLGPEGAPLVKQLTTASDSELQRLERLFASSGKEAGDNFAMNLSDAGPILQEVARRHGRAAASRLARELAAGKTTLQDIVRNYNLTTSVSVQTGQAERQYYSFVRSISGKSVSVQVNYKPGKMPGLVAGFATGGQPRRLSSGLISGPGTPTSDSILARVSTREFIHNASAVDHYGVRAMYALNSKQIPREVFAAMGYASGGQPGTRPSVTVPTPTSARLSLDTSGISAAVADGLAGVRIVMVDPTSGVERLVDARIEMAGRRSASTVRRR
ncbi:tape measure protein [Clostridioides difficile]